MTATIIVCAATCLVMILSVLFFPKLKVGKISIDTYWVVTLIGAIIALCCGFVDIETVLYELTLDTVINPLKIVILFICMTILSIFLDELGFFKFLANETLKKAGANQTKLFFLLYVTVSVLTIFTSNDIIILSFTPFICYFAKHAKISPIPYLAAEFVGANTWSMALIIGNPTNIYLCSAIGADFLTYSLTMILPTIAAGLVALLFLFLMFRKKLKEPICDQSEKVVIRDKFKLKVGIVHLIVTTLLMAISSYINLEMWTVSLIAVISLTIWCCGISLIRNDSPHVLGATFRRAPYPLIPFILSMFVLIVALKNKDVPNSIANLFGDSAPVWKYGIASFLSSNLINNIPMSVLFSSIIENVGQASVMQAVYATVIGSNLGACLTPIGALAGIMWSSILHKHDLKFGFLDFLKIGICIAIPSLIAALGVLQLIL